MGNAKCEKTMSNYIALDRGERVPLQLWTHLLLCKKCRSEVRLLSIADSFCTKPIAIERKPQESLASAILQSIKNNPETKNLYTPKELSLKNWILAGSLMLFAMLFFGINVYSQNTQIALPVYLIFAIFITGYCALFVGSNLDFFIKKLKNLEILF